MQKGVTKRRVDFAADRLEIGRAIAWIAAAAADMGATERQLFGAKLCAEELLANLLRHGAGAPSVSLTLEHTSDRLILAIEDDDAPFDPTCGPQRERLGALEDALPGGWGLALVRRFADQLSYERTERGNLVALAFTSERCAP